MARIFPQRCNLGVFPLDKPSLAVQSDEVRQDNRATMAISLEPTRNPGEGMSSPRRRSWLWYTGVTLVGLALALISVLAGLSLYWRSLVRSYTDIVAAPLPEARDSDLERNALWVRWALFYETVRQGRPAEPFAITADEINLLITGNPELRDRLRIQITNGTVYAHFSFPLGQEGQRSLHGRYLNGRARLQVNFSDGWLTLHVAEMEAQQKPIPRWILKRLQRMNLARDLDRNPDALEFLQQLEAIEASGDRLVLRPVVSGR